MRTWSSHLGKIIAAFAVAVHARAAVFYVDVNSTNATPPYSDWTTASTDIQSAVDAATNGDQIWVNNGIYQTGGRTANGSLTNRVVINKTLTVQSVNGPASTIIQGYQVPGTTNGSSAVRCAYITNGATLSGFTLTNGATIITYGNDGSAGGVFCDGTNGLSVSNCWITGNAAYYQGGGSYQGTLVNCSLLNNRLFGYNGGGGGAYQGMLINCLVSGNAAGNSSGGGVFNIYGTNCLISNNSSSYSFANTMAGNSVPGGGGGACFGTLVNCTIINNSLGLNHPYASGSCGGGLNSVNATNCLIAGNSCPFANTQYAGAGGGGSYSGNLVNCTIVGNTSSGPGGSDNDNLVNCIIYLNTSTPGMYYSNVYDSPSYSIYQSDPLLVSMSSVATNSPCLGMGNPRVTYGTDINGRPWKNPPAIGCAEICPGNTAGSLSFGVLAPLTNQAAGFPVNFQANVLGPVYATSWNFGNGTTATNRPFITHSWPAAGNYSVTLTAYSDTYPAGQSATVGISIYKPTTNYVVSPNTSNQVPVIPYDTWAKAATNLQNAISVAYPGNVILVSNGVFTNASMSYRGNPYSVLVTNPLTIQSVNGPAKTRIDCQMGGIGLISNATLIGLCVSNCSSPPAAVYCVYTNALVINCLLVNNYIGTQSGIISNCVYTGNTAYGAYYGALSNCMISNNPGSGCFHGNLFGCLVISNGNTGYAGGGLWQGTAINCKFIGNIASYGAGVEQSSATNCLIFGNIASQQGGGADGSTLVNCTVVGNSAPTNGGVTYGSLLNSVIYYNLGGSNCSGVSLRNCCTIPLLPGPGNFTNAPQFVNSSSDFHLQSNSPCINAGSNCYLANPFSGLISATNDLDGNPRLVDRAVDVGAYEYQTPASVISYQWLQQYGLPTDGSADFADSDGDGFNNYQEWIAGTNPTDAASGLVMYQPVPATNGVIISWQSVSNISYFIQRSTNLAAQSFATIHSGSFGPTGLTSFTDTSTTNAGNYYYRVGVLGFEQ